MSRSAALLVLVVVVTIAFFALVLDFLLTAFWAAVLATVFAPLQRRYVRAARGPTIATVLTMLTIIGLVVVPLGLVVAAMAREAVQLQQQIAQGTIDVKAPVRLFQRLVPLVGDVLDRFGIDLNRLAEQVSGAAVSVTQFLATRVLSIGQNVLEFTALFFVMLYVLFFFLRDGDRLVEVVVRALPLGDRRERRLLDRIALVIRATIKGTLVVGAVQGAIGGVAFWALGIPAPVFWGAVMTLMSLLPAVGPAIVWVPAAIVLLAIGSIAKAIILVAVGVLLIGLVDNLLRPILVGRDVGIPDYLVLLATLGGLAVFGVSGFVIGPVIAAVFLTAWSMFAEDHAPRG